MFGVYAAAELNVSIFASFSCHLMQIVKQEIKRVKETSEVTTAIEDCLVF